MRSVVFRADASIDLGTGHVERCLTLADALVKRGATVCRFVCRDLSGNLIHKIILRGYKVFVIQGKYKNSLTDAHETIEALVGHRVDWLIVDHYSLNIEWEKQIKAILCKVMVIDDLADRSHDCDLLLDQNLGRKKSDYDFLTPDYCLGLFGPEYALLRPAFSAVRSYSLQRRRHPMLKQLLITMGGVDRDNTTVTILNALAITDLSNDCKITVVLGENAPWINDVQNLARTLRWRTEVLVNVANMSQLMADADLAIGAAGGTSWERCCVGLPTIVVVLASNQKSNAKHLIVAGAAKALDLDENLPIKLGDLLNFFRQSKNLSSISERASKLVDGRGAERVSEVLIDAAD